MISIIFSLKYWYYCEPLEETVKKLLNTLHLFYFTFLLFNSFVYTLFNFGLKELESGIFPLPSEVWQKLEFDASGLSLTFKIPEKLGLIEFDNLRFGLAWVWQK